MKKVLLFSIVALTLSTSSFAQKFKTFDLSVGLLSAIPTDANSDKLRVDLGSTWFQVSSKYNSKFTGTFDFGYVRFSADAETNFSVLPMNVGVKYAVNDNVYFGSSVGVGFFNNSDYGKTSFMFSPYVGVKMGHVNLDARYINVVEKNNPVKTIAIGVSYTL